MSFYLREGAVDSPPAEAQDSLVFLLSIVGIHMEIGGRGGTESHINLIWS